MASVCIISFFGLLITAFYIQSGCALRMEANPQPFSQLSHSTLDISCIDDGSTARHVVVMQIQRPDQKAIAVINGNEGLTIGPSGTYNIQASGHLDAHAGRSNLMITVSKPGVGDAGMYECVMFYLDSSYQLKEIRADFNVSIRDEDIWSVVSYFKGILQMQAGQIEALQDTVSKQTNQMAALRDDASKQLTITTDQANNIEQLNITTREQEQQLKHMKAKASYQCAFSMRYKVANKIIQGQTLLFTHTDVNIGNAYDVKSGIFTAPRDGIYVFHLVLTTIRGGDYMVAYLHKNGSPHIEMAVKPRDRAFGDTSSGSVVISLLTGDTIQPKVSYASAHTTTLSQDSIFSGFLLSLS